MKDKMRGLVLVLGVFGVVVLIGTSFVSALVTPNAAPEIYYTSTNWALNKATSTEKIDLYFVGDVQIRSSDKHTSGGYATRGRIWYLNTTNRGEVSTSDGLGPNDTTIRKASTLSLDNLIPWAAQAQFKKEFRYNKFSNGIYPLDQPADER